MSTAIQFDDDERSSLYQQESREPRESQESQESQLFDSPTIIAAPVAPAVAAPIMAPPTEPSVLLSGNTFLRAEPSFAVDGSDMAAAIDHQASAGQARMQRRFISGNNGGARNADGRQDANDRQHTGQPEVVTHSRTHRPSLPKPFDVVPADGHALNLPRFRGIPAAGGKSEDGTS